MEVLQFIIISRELGSKGYCRRQMAEYIEHAAYYPKKENERAY
jgi:hypothetical protein